MTEPTIEDVTRRYEAVKKRVAREKAEAAASDNSGPECWDIHGTGQGGWFAWNGWTRTRKDLGYCSFSDAVKTFDAEIGPYYASRGKRHHPGAGHE